MFGKRDEQAPAQEYRGNLCSPPWPRATNEELEQSAAEFDDIMDDIFDLLERATALMDNPVEDSGAGPRYSPQGWSARFPVCGQQVYEELHGAKAAVIEANKLVAVQGYAAQRRNRRSE